MRVAVFTETFLPKLDGIVRVVCLLLDHLQANGIETLVIAPDFGGDINEYNGNPIIRVNGVPIPWYPEVKWCAPGINTYRKIQDFQPDVAHFIHPAGIGIPSMMMLKTLDVPMLASFHLDFAGMAAHYRMSFMSPLADYITKVTFNWADYCLAPSKHIQQKMIDIGIEDVGLWKRGVDAERFHPGFYSESMRDELSDGHPEDTLLLYVGRLSPEKQVDKLRAVLEAVPGTRLALVGDGPSRQELEQHFAGTNTKFMGYMQGDALSQAYASADIFTFPSALETFGLVVVEAMAAGLPVVASRVGGIPDVVEEGRTGYTFDAGDVEGLITGVQRITADKTVIQQMGLQARAYAETQTWGVMMDEVIEHYERLTAVQRMVQSA